MLWTSESSDLGPMWDFHLFLFLSCARLTSINFCVICTSMCALAPFSFRGRCARHWNNLSGFRDRESKRILEPFLHRHVCVTRVSVRVELENTVLEVRQILSNYGAHRPEFQPQEFCTCLFLCWFSSCEVLRFWDFCQDRGKEGARHSRKQFLGKCTGEPLFSGILKCSDVIVRSRLVRRSWDSETLSLGMALFWKLDPL